MTTVWLLDVDGVINTGRPGWTGHPQKGTAKAMGQTWTLRWEPQLIDRIHALIDNGTVDVRWCTTWCPYADQLETLFGWPTLPRALEGPNIPGGASDWLKLQAAKTVLAEGHRLIWTDDTAINAAPTFVVAPTRGLLISPDPRHGLRPVHMGQIEQFATAA